MTFVLEDKYDSSAIEVENNQIIFEYKIPCHMKI